MTNHAEPQPENKFLQLFRAAFGADGSPDESKVRVGIQQTQFAARRHISHEGQVLASFDETSAGSPLQLA